MMRHSNDPANFSADSLRLDSPATTRTITRAINDQVLRRLRRTLAGSVVEQDPHRWQCLEGLLRQPD